MTETVTVRDCDRADEELISRIRRLAFGAPTWSSLPWDGWRGFIAELDGTPCGLLRVLDYGQFFGGVSVPMGGLASVAVDPHARGRGVASALLDAALAGMRAAGQCVATLYASAPALYRSRGWEQTGLLEWLDLPIARLHEIPAPATPTVLRPATDADTPAMLAAYQAVARTVDGMLDRASAGYSTAELGRGEVHDLVLDAAGEVTGFLVADRPVGDQERPFLARELVTAETDSLAGVLRSLGSWTGQLDQLAVRVLDPAAYQLVLPLPAHHQSRVAPWMLRVVDFPAAIAARGWPAATALRDGAVDLELVDRYAPWHAGRHRLVVEGGAVRCEPGGRGAVRLLARALGPWYAGSVSTGALRRAGLLTGEPADCRLLDALISGGTGTPRLMDAF